jgi:hypothetical protein
MKTKIIFRKILSFLAVTNMILALTLNDYTEQFIIASLMLTIILFINEGGPDQLSEI